MKIYNAQIIKRTWIEKRVYNEGWKTEISTTFMFNEIDQNEFYSDEQAAKGALFHMIKDEYDYRGLMWIKSVSSFMFGDREKYHSSFIYEKNGNKIDYFALINEIEVE